MRDTVLIATLILIGAYSSKSSYPVDNIDFESVENVSKKNMSGSCTWTINPLNTLSHYIKYISKI